MEFVLLLSIHVHFRHNINFFLSLSNHIKYLHFSKTFLITQLSNGFSQIISEHFPDQKVKRLISEIENIHSTEMVSPQRVKVICNVISIVNFHIEKI